MSNTIQELLHDLNENKAAAADMLKSLVDAWHEQVAELDALRARVDEVTRERDEAQRAKYGTPCKCESWIETCGVLEDRLATQSALLKRALDFIKNDPPYGAYMLWQRAGDSRAAEMMDSYEGSRYGLADDIRAALAQDGTEVKP